MPTATQNWVEEFVDVAGTRTQVLKGGSGSPLLVLHGAGGNPGWMPYHEALSEHFTVYAPSHPGYDHTARPSWVKVVVGGPLPRNGQSGCRRPLRTAPPPPEVPALPASACSPARRDPW